MFSHVYVGVSDFERALKFYRALMICLGHTEKFCELERLWAGWHDPKKERPLFLIGKPYDRNPHLVGNGQMTAFVVFCRSYTRDSGFGISVRVRERRGL